MTLILDGMCERLIFQASPKGGQRAVVRMESPFL